MTIYLGPKSKIRVGSSMQNIVVGTREKIDNNRLRNDKALVL